MIRLRYNLGRGKNYKKWQVAVYDAKGKLLEKHHFDPKTTRIFLLGARLKNSRVTAEKIFHGNHKTVCAWIEAERIAVNQVDEIPMTVSLNEEDKLSYNPRKAPYWVNHQNLDRDGEFFNVLVTDNRNIYDISDQIQF